MRSMLQLLGGVAVAGAVAAGTTAFTAGGVDTTGAVALAGGTAAITVEGAQLDSAVFITGSTAGTYDQISGITLGLSGAGTATLDDASKVSVTFVGTGETNTGGAVDSTPIDCGTGTSGVWTCHTTSAASDYWTGITSVSIKVAAVAT
jgi:hypothetical protein